MTVKQIFYHHTVETRIFGVSKSIKVSQQKASLAWYTTAEGGYKRRVQ